jgi:purine-nucleoside phosphorylase
VSTVVPRLDEAVRFIAGRTALRPRTALVLGSGLGAFADTLQDAVRIPYKDIPHFPVSTAVGHSGTLVIGRSEGVVVAVMAGRVHFYEGYKMQEVVFPARVLGRFGIDTLVLTNAAGAINKAWKPGDLMIIEDHINLMGTNPMIGPNVDELGLRFFDLTVAYDAGLRKMAAAACVKARLRARRGVYVALTGPSYETPAEIRMLRKMGADAVGMSTVPEVIAARQMGMRVLGISCMSNMAACILKKPLHYQEVLDVGERIKDRLMKVLRGVIVSVDKNRKRGK